MLFFRLCFCDVEDLINSIYTSSYNLDAVFLAYGIFLEFVSSAVDFYHDVKISNKLSRFKFEQQWDFTSLRGQELKSRGL